MWRGMMEARAVSLKKIFFFVLFYVYECFFLFHVHVWYPRKRTLDPLELGLQMVVIHHVMTGN